MKQALFLIAAVDENLGIGKNGHMPWNLKKELQYFQELTTKTVDPLKRNMLIMGRRTWDSLPLAGKPLKGRRNVVITRQLDFEAEGAEIVHSLGEALYLADEGIETIFVIGGGSVYSEAIDHPLTSGVYLTKIANKFACDTFFPPIPPKFKKIEKLGGDEENGLGFEYLKLSR